MFAICNGLVSADQVALHAGPEALVRDFSVAKLPV
jgi:hypothetical protein